MLSVAEALSRIENGVDRLPAEQVNLTNGLGRVLAEDVAARVTHPPEAVSAMDGYAVKAADVATVPATLSVIGEAAAGHPFEGSVSAGGAVRIFTGGVVPLGADCIVIQEDTDQGADRVQVNEGAAEGTYVRPAGLDFTTGDVLLKAGQRLSARDIGLAGAMNVSWFRVVRKPLVAVIATGDEVVMPGDALGPGQIVSSNSVALEAYLKVMGARAMSLGIVPDQPDALADALKAAEGADLVVTTGGASVGDHDLVRQTLDRDDVDLGFYRIAMRPGKPLIFGHIGDLPLLGLPGNPVSTGVTSLLFLRTALQKMLGLASENLRPENMILGEAVPKNGKREDYMRAVIDGDGATVRPLPRQDSSMMAAFAGSDALIVRPPHDPAQDIGARVPVIRLRFGSETF